MSTGCLMVIDRSRLPNEPRLVSWDDLQEHADRQYALAQAIEDRFLRLYPNEDTRDPSLVVFIQMIQEEAAEWPTCHSLEDAEANLNKD